MTRFHAELESGSVIPDRPQRILVPVDFSPESNAALRYAMTLAEPTSAIDVVHVWDLPSYVGGGMVDTRLSGDDPQAPRYAAQYVHDIATERMAELLRPWSEDARVNGMVLDGDVGTILTDLSRRYDLIVIGRSPGGSAAEGFLGSAAQKVLAEATCPVVTVHERRDSEAA